MKNSRRLLLFVLLLSVRFSLAAQSHISVPLEDPVYYVLEQAETRGLSPFLPGAKPYSRAKILSAIDLILSNEPRGRLGRLSEREREILERFRSNFAPPEKGLNLGRGSYNFGNSGGKIHLSAEIDVDMDFLFGAGYTTREEEFDAAADITALGLSLSGDLGLQTSYGFAISGGIFNIPRENLGAYRRYHDAFTNPEGFPSDSLSVDTYSEPLSFFPYTHKKRWDTFVWNISDISNASHKPWPDALSVGYSMLPEFAGDFLDGHIFFRAARLDREWGAMTNNGSLVLNRTAQPFLGMELTVTPFSWLSFSSLAGVLEYDFISSLKDDAARYQNGFSVNLLEVNIKNYLHMDLGSTAIWPKRFELGYLFPLTEKFLYQNNVGDFDNMSLFFNIRGQYPGLGKLWFSVYLDEANNVMDGNLFSLNEQMFAFQAGASAGIPFLPFSSVTLSYTKIEPYTYTHNRIQTPWYGTLWMETGYTSGGKGLGSYLPPNSDEILVRFESLLNAGAALRLQYQLIRHGASYGGDAVDGSSYYSELDPNRGGLTKDFLGDGAYEWMHIFKLGGEYSFASLRAPVKLFCEAGFVSSSYSGSIDHPEDYPETFRLIGVLGVEIFPK